jgi:tellurite resistance protein TehA-like permease
MKFFYALCIMISGVFIGAVLFSSMRVWFYIYQGIQPNMAPQMFILFSPIMGVLISVPAILLQVVFRKIINFNSYWKWFLAGLSYSSVLLGLITPWLLAVFILLNPLSLKLLKELYLHFKDPKLL